MIFILVVAFIIGVAMVLKPLLEDVERKSMATRNPKKEVK